MSPVRLCLFGAPGINANLGLGALMQGALAGIYAHRPDAEVTVFDDALGVRPATVHDADGQVHRYTRMGARLSRRFYRPESYTAMRASRLVGGRGSPGMRAVLDADGVLDVSGGDSFSDIYGELRFRRVAAPKQLALRAGRPLVLLPQTYGPFRSPATARAARALVLGARQAWARDDDSFAVLSELLGPDLDPHRHRAGVDMAFLLPARRSQTHPTEVTEALARSPAPIGVNVSGLLWNHQQRFALALDYRATMTALVARLVTDGHRVVLVPHVVGLDRDGEADNTAAEELRGALPPAVAAQVVAVPWLDDAAEAKGVISACSFFVGTRMHSTIAALSSAVPCVAVAYSPKYHGVFASAGLPHGVLDARRLDGPDLVDAVAEAAARAPATARELSVTVPSVRRRARDQMAEILEAIGAQQ